MSQSLVDNPSQMFVLQSSSISKLLTMYKKSVIRMAFPIPHHHRSTSGHHHLLRWLPGRSYRFSASVFGQEYVIDDQRALGSSHIGPVLGSSNGELDRCVIQSSLTEMMVNGFLGHLKLTNID